VLSSGSLIIKLGGMLVSLEMSHLDCMVLKFAYKIHHNRSMGLIALSVALSRSSTSTFHSVACLEQWRLG
jgi:hypothetical protein